MYFINGFYWKDKAVPSLATFSEGGQFAAMKTKDDGLPFHGFIGRERMDQVPGQVTDGYIVDMLGEREIKDFVLSQNKNRLSFTTHHIRTSQVTNFELRRVHGRHFVGTWSIGDKDITILAEERVICVLDEVFPAMLDKEHCWEV